MQLHVSGKTLQRTPTIFIYARAGAGNEPVEGSPGGAPSGDAAQHLHPLSERAYGAVSLCAYWWIRWRQGATSQPPTFTNPFSTAQIAICTRESKPSLLRMRVTYVSMVFTPTVIASAISRLDLPWAINAAT